MYKHINKAGEQFQIVMFKYYEPLINLEQVHIIYVSTIQCNQNPEWITPHIITHIFFLFPFPDYMRGQVMLRFDIIHHYFFAKLSPSSSSSWTELALLSLFPSSNPTKVSI